MFLLLSFPVESETHYVQEAFLFIAISPEPRAAPGDNRNQINVVKWENKLWKGTKII